MSDFLRDAAERAIHYIDTVNERRVFPTEEAIAALSQLNQPFPASPTEPAEIVKLLDEYGSPATVASTGGRYFGFVTGGILPASVAANWLMAAWDQNGGLRIGSPVAAALEEIALRWVLESLDFPTDFAGAFTTGATMANFTCLAAARTHLLSRAGWNVELQGLFGAPEIKVVVGDEVHVSLLQALSMLGLGRERVIRVPVDEQGRMKADALPELDAMTIVCIQAGNVNSGSFDDAATICDIAHKAGAWVHVDGAFGLWVLASPEKRHLAQGFEKADSWATDGHKWLNVSYDNGIALCRHAQAMQAAMTIHAPYLIMTEAREPEHYTPEMSRRARGIEIWAALKSLGRSGLAAIVECDCRHAQRFAAGFREAGFTVHNEVVINQILVSFGDAATTDRVITAIQQDGTLWAGRSVWQGNVGMRLSVSSWRTTEDDVEQSLAAIIRIANEVRQMA
jgi:glutamate/tyrosine decarboxylase-like PLP-dependent enzyme